MTKAPPSPPAARPVPPPVARSLEALLPELRRAARRRCASWQDADDLVQETLLRIWTRLANPAADDILDLRAYAFAALKGRFRAGTAPEHALLRDAGRPAEAPARLACADTLAAIDALPREQAALLRLRAIEGHSYAEIARMTGLPLGTVTSRLARGRAALCRTLELDPGTPVSGLLSEG